MEFTCCNYGYADGLGEYLLLLLVGVGAIAGLIAVLGWVGWLLASEVEL